MAPPRMTAQTLAVLALLLEDPTAEWHGFGLIDRTKIKSGTLYPILIRLEKAGWLESRLEAVDPHVAGRPPRRLYVLTGEGERLARAGLASHMEALAPAAARLPLVPRGRMA
jgi:PadR family transcriptional regulator, regulatory protein PadR